MASAVTVRYFSEINPEFIAWGAGEFAHMARSVDVFWARLPAWPHPMPARDAKITLVSS